ncbi:hypothetical protein ACQR1I_20705 [Bradyrhizobium sp. HKCCYLS2038]|uniref:hypothetical protein n=1 Tax=unclassified Bradyrhizobium TaxID=2631580 RepID=UPI003EB98DAC
MFRLVGYVGVLLASFFAAFWLMDRHADQHSPLLGTHVLYELTAEQRPEVCATQRSTIRFKGSICDVSGDNLSVLWTSLANITNAQPSCGPQRVVSWARRDGEPAYNGRFLGSCGRRPDYFDAMPSTFAPNELRASRD